MIEISKDSRKIEIYLQQITGFLQNYTWILDAYVSDFFFKNHWDRLPTSWCSTLSSWSTEELSFLIDREPIHLKSVAPLSLLSFKACCDTFSLSRRYETNFTDKLQFLFNKETNCSNRDWTAERCSKNLQVNNICSSDEDGKLHAFFRKHVKPKKQHEIKNLAQVIYLLSKHIDCDSVIDVGSGLGHLARLLSFGYNLRVTSVEAAGTHAPKATKYDREIDREIRKKMKTKHGEFSVDTESQRPCHVTTMIRPNMSTREFLNIVKSQRNEQMLPDTDESRLGFDSGGSHIFSSNRGMDHRQTVSTFKDTHELSCDEEINQPNVATDTAEDLHLSSALRFKEHKETCISNELTTDASLDGAVGNTVEVNKKHVNICTKNHKLGDSKCHSGDIDNVKEIQTRVCDDRSNEINKQENDIHVHEIVERNLDGSTTCDPYALQNNSEEKTQNDLNDNSEEMVESTRWRFVLTGLHACGDLTPTFLRFFVNCDAAVGLVSVGCCYMKISDDRSINETVGYPMSDYVASLPHHSLSYASRELACHFADTYSQRLKDCPPHLKIHSYRAALEWIANHLCPGFKRTAVQIPTKKTDSFQFERYVRIGLQKLNIPEERLTDDLLATASQMTHRWKDVVAFYTLRLALAPVVETLVLLDRMMFLFENEKFVPVLLLLNHYQIGVRKRLRPLEI